LLVLHSGVMKVSIIYLAFDNRWMDVFFCNVFCVLSFSSCQMIPGYLSTPRGTNVQSGHHKDCAGLVKSSISQEPMPILTLFQTRFHRQATLIPLNPDPTYVYFGR
jgi:hypothetical protein